MPLSLWGGDNNSTRGVRTSDADRYMHQHTDGEWQFLHKDMESFCKESLQHCNGEESEPERERAVRGEGENWRK